MNSEDEITASMRRYHQQRREYILAQLEKEEEKKERRREIEDLQIQCVQTAQMMAGQTDSLPISIPLR